MTEIQTRIFPVDVLRDFCTRVFMHCGVPKSDAAQAAEAEQQRRRLGVPLILPIIEELRDVSRATGIPFE